MNMQTIQIMILLLDSLIKLAPWRIVTEMMDRIGYGASESLARNLGVIAAACAGLCAPSTASIFGSLLLIVYSEIWFHWLYKPAARCSAISCWGLVWASWFETKRGCARRVCAPCCH
jgi:hypothetical protein